MWSNSGYAGVHVAQCRTCPLPGAGCLFVTVGQGLRLAPLGCMLLTRRNQPALVRVACPRWHIVRRPTPAWWRYAASCGTCHQCGLVLCQCEPLRVRLCELQGNCLRIGAVGAGAYRGHCASNKQWRLWRLRLRGLAALWCFSGGHCARPCGGCGGWCGTLGGCFGLCVCHCGNLCIGGQCVIA